MCDMRENIYTQFASSINKFAEHKITKVDLYENFCAMIEMCTNHEKNDRIEHKIYVKEADGDLIKLNKMEHSNYQAGWKMVI